MTAPDPEGPRDKRPDENDLLKAGKLPADPAAGTERVALVSRVRGPVNEVALCAALLWSGANQPDMLRVNVVLDLLPDGAPFFDRNLADIYEACVACAADKQEHDPVAVSSRLVTTGKSRPATSYEALVRLMSNASTVSEKQARVFATKITRAWSNRVASNEARQLVEIVRNPQTEPAAVLELAQRLTDTVTKGALEELWPEPEPLGATALPEFPIDALASWQGEWCVAESQFTQTPIDLAACLAVGAASFAVCRRFDLQVRGGWIEPTNTWHVVALPPGERKSVVFGDACRPIFRHAEREADRLAPSIANRKLERRVLQGQIDAAEAAAIRGAPYGGQDAMQAAREMHARLAELPELRTPTLTVDDCTAEALAVVLSQNDERAGLFSSEGGAFELWGGRYSERGAPNIELALKTHSGDSHVVHRIRREPIQLTRPLLVAVMTVQPSVISALTSKQEFRGRGLLARFLFSMPVTALGERETDPDPVPPAILQGYEDALSTLLALPPAQRTLRLSAGADRARAALQSALEPRLAPGADLHAIADWAGKLTGAVCRIAAVLHVADAATYGGQPRDEIPAATFERATRLGEYFLQHALAAFDAMAADESAELAKRVWSWVERSKLREFSEREARRATHAKSEQLAQALAQLVERHLVRELPRRPTRGRPSRMFAVSPRCRP